MAKETSGGTTMGVTLPTPSDETMGALLELAGLAGILIGGPYAHGVVAIVRVLNSFRKDYQIDPDYEKYFEAMERIVEGQRRRREAKEGKTW